MHLLPPSTPLSPHSRRPARAATLLAIAALALTLPACHRAPEGPKSGAARPAPDPIDVRLAPVVTAPVERTIEVSGTLFADEDTVIAAKLAGRITAVRKDSGDPAAPSELLAQIDPRDYELALDEKRAAAAAALARLGLTQLGLTQLPGEDFDPARLPMVVRARAEAANAQARLERARQLFEQTPPLLSAQDFADIRTAAEVAASQADVELLTARATLADARAQAAGVATAAQRLEDTAVRAPAIEGRPDLRYRVAERRVSVGEYVAQGQPVYRLVAADPIKYRAQVPDRFAGRVELNHPARVHLGDQTTDAHTINGQVARVWPTVDPASRTFLVEILLPNPHGDLKPGAFAKGEIVHRTDPAATFVPEAAVTTFAGLSRVFSVENAKAVEHRVQLGLKRDGLIEITSGLAGPTRVVVSGAAGLADGTPVRATDAPTAAAKPAGPSTARTNPGG